MAADSRYANGAAFVDGSYVPLAEARIPITDWGFIHSDVTYDVVHVWKGLFFRLEDHLERFAQSMEALRLNCPYDRAAQRDILAECVRLTGLREAYVEMICTRGVPQVPGSRDPRDCRNAYYAFVAPFIWVANEEQRTRGLHLYVSSVQQIPPESLNPVIKNFHWLDFTQGLFEAYDHGAETCVLTDGRGYVTEGPGFNLFLVQQGRVQTPESHVLEGVTRRTVLDLCAEEGIPAEATRVPVERLREADEVFLASTAGGVLPVTRLDDRRVGDGTPGPLTTRLREAYWRRKEEGWHGTPVAYD